MTRDELATGKVDLTDLQDMRAQVPHTRQQLAAAITALDEQLARTIAIYGDRVQWPASSEMTVRDLEDKRDNLGGRLQREEQYLAELEAEE